MVPTLHGVRLLEVKAPDVGGNERSTSGHLGRVTL
jgi:hypothetical protein